MSNFRKFPGHEVGWNFLMSKSLVLLWKSQFHILRIPKMVVKMPGFLEENPIDFEKL